MSSVQQANVAVYSHHLTGHEYRYEELESQARMSPFMRPEMTPLFMSGGSEHYTHPSHPPHHYYHNFSYPSHHETAAAMAAQRNVILNNATLPPPVGDNCTGTYHNTAGPANLGIAVATSMHLTNSSEPMGAGAAPDYKIEPGDMNYYTNTSVDPMNQTTDQLFQSVIDEQLLWGEDMNFNASDNLYGASAAASSGATVLPGIQEAAAANGPAVVLGANGAMGQSTAGATSLGATDERMDASSDSAVSSMGSERVPSLSDGEWMETGSNSSHTQADSHYSMDYAGKYRMPYDCGYPLSNGRSSGQRSCQQAAADRGGLAPVAQKKHQMFGKRCFQEQSPMNVPSAGAATGHHPAVTSLKYDYEAAQTVAAGPPGQAYSGPIEGAAGPQPEMKYSYSLDFARQTGRSSLEHVQHNHTYHLPPESSGSLQRPTSRDKKARKSEAEEHLTRDEKRARNLNVPISVNDIINLPMDEFNERLSKYDLSENQLSLIRDIRRRGKNKVAAQNCRKRKLDQINCLSDEVKQMRDRKIRLVNESRYMKQERDRVKDRFSQLYHHIFSSLRDQHGQPYDGRSYSLQETADGSVMVVPRSSQAAGHYPHSRVDPSRSNGKPDSQGHQQQQQQQQQHPQHPHHHHHQEHKE